MKATFLYRYILELSTFEYGCFDGATYQGGEEAEVGSGALMSSLCLISHR